jgi:hypothetical protein
MAAIGLLQFANQATTTLATTITSSATSLTVTAGQGTLFPSPASGQYFKITFYPATGSTPAPEIMHVTARSTDTFTVIRAQEGTTAQNWSSGSLVENLLTAGTMNSLSQITQYAGNPNGFVAGFSAGASNPPSMVWDTSNNLAWVCITSGPAASAGWIAQAPLNSPGFTGNPTALTQISTDNSTRLATTAFVNSYAAKIAGDPAQAFNVLNAATATQAVALGQFTLAGNVSSWTAKFPNGLRINGGQISVGNPTSVSFYTNFATNPLGMVVGECNAGGSWLALSPTVHGYSSLSVSGYQGYALAWSSGSWVSGAIAQAYVAFGY